jgi:hypothetical protein
MDGQQQLCTPSLDSTIPTTHGMSGQSGDEQYDLSAGADDELTRLQRERETRQPSVPSTSASVSSMTEPSIAPSAPFPPSLQSASVELQSLRGTKRLAETDASKFSASTLSLRPRTVEDQWRYLAETRQDKYHPTDQLEKDRQAALDLVKLFKRNRDTAPDLLQSVERYAQKLSEPNEVRFAQETVQQTSLAVNSYLEALKKSPERDRQSTPNHRWMMLVLPEILSAWDTVLHTHKGDANLVLIELQDEYGQSLWKVSNDSSSQKRRRLERKLMA